MPRLPNPGNDANNWGALLNEFLQVAHNTDGTLRLAPAVFNVRDFGAKAATGVDDRAAIQAAIDTAATAGGGTVYIPPGQYNLTAAPGSRAALVINHSDIRLIGDGYASHLHTMGLVGKWAVAALAVSLPNGVVEHTELAGLRLTSEDIDNLADLDGTGIITTKVAINDLSIHDCFIDTRSLVGFNNDATTHLLRFYNNHIIRTGSHGIYVAGTASDVWVQNNKFDGVASTSPEIHATGIALKNISGCYLTNNTISSYPYSAINAADYPNTRLFIIGNTIRDLVKQGAAGMVMNWGTKILIANNLFDNLNNTGILCQAAHAIDEVRITNNEFRDVHSGRAITVEQLNGNRPSNISILNNWCEECSQGIETDGVAGLLRISGNQIRKTASDNNPGIYVLNAGNADTMIDHNIIRGYTGTSIDPNPAVVRLHNLINGVLQ